MGSLGGGVDGGRMEYGESRVLRRGSVEVQGGLITGGASSVKEARRMVKGRGEGLRLTQGNGISVVIESRKQNIGNGSGIQAEKPTQMPAPASRQASEQASALELRRQQSWARMMVKKEEKNQRRLAKNALYRQKTLQSKERKQAGLKSAATSTYTTAPNSPVRTPRPRHLERIAVAPIATIVESSLTIGDADLTSTVLLLTPSPDRTFPPLDPTNPNAGTTRPGVEAPGYYEDPSWVCSVVNPLPTPEQDLILTPEFEMAAIFSQQSEGTSTDGEGETSGASPTSYSQRPRSPNFLINMYRVRSDLTVKTPRGMSLFHTKKVYIGERKLLDMDMTGDSDEGVMGVDEVEILMDEMDDGETGDEVKLGSVQRDLEVGGRGEKALEYVKWG